jgi:hypothetical protein
MPEDAALRQWAAYMLEASINLGCALDSVDSVRELMIEAGFVDVEKRSFCWPTNQWPKHPRLKKIGKTAHTNGETNLGIDSRRYLDVPRLHGVTFRYQPRALH